MLYKIYGSSSKKGWELIMVINNKDFIETVIEKIDQNDYNGYMVIEYNTETRTDTVLADVRFDEQPTKRKHKKIR